MVVGDKIMGARVISDGMTDWILEISKLRKGSKEIIEKALKAGADLLLMPVSLTDAESAIKAALSSGELSEERIDLSVRRILMKKFASGL